jgi:hypothetical protein
MNAAHMTRSVFLPWIKVSFSDRPLFRETYLNDVTTKRVVLNFSTQQYCVWGILCVPYPETGEKPWDLNQYSDRDSVPGKSRYFSVLPPQTFSLCIILYGACRTNKSYSFILKLRPTLEYSIYSQTGFDDECAFRAIYLKYRTITRRNWRGWTIFMLKSNTIYFSIFFAIALKVQNL